MAKTLQTVELLLGGRLKEVSDDQVLRLLVLSVCELALCAANKIWVRKKVGKKRAASKQIKAMAQALYCEARRRMKNKTAR